MTRRGSINSKSFRNTAKALLTNNSFLKSENTTMENKGKPISDNLKLIDIFHKII